MATDTLQYLDPDGLGETVLNIAQIKTSLDEEMQDLPYARPDGIYPDMTVGAVIGADETAQWATRESTGSGAATVRSVQGASEVQDGELLPVRIAGIQSTGFNHFKLDGRTNVIWPSYPASDKRAMSESNIFKGITISNIGGSSLVNFTTTDNGYVVTAASNGYGLGLPVPVSPNTTYHVQHGSTDPIGVGCYAEDGTYIRFYGGSASSVDFTAPDNCQWIMVVLRPAINTPTTYENICVNVSSTRNGEYEPYRIVDAIEWPTFTLRAAGTIRDELTAGELVTRVGERAYQSGDESDATVRTDGTTTYYPLATPTTTPISPALPMTYKVQQGGSESIIVPEGEVSAAPVITIAEPVNAGDEFARIWEAIQSLGYTRNATQLSRPVSLTDIGSIDEVKKDTADVAEIDTTKEVQE